jgi:tetratricopeptide (TPR) repeat protein
MAEPATDQLAALKRAIAERQYDEAIRGARRLVLESNRNPEARLLLGEALLASGRNDEARVEMLALVRERPEEPAAHRLLGEAHLRDGQLEPARASLRRAVELDPDDEAARDLLLEADSEVAAPISSTVERWMGAVEPPTTEMQMPEYLQEAPAMTPSASLRSLLEGAEPKKPKISIPRPGAPATTAAVTAKHAPPPGPSGASVSVEVEIDPDATTGQVHAAGRVDPRPSPEREPTGEIPLDDEELAPSPTMVQPEAPRPRTAPPPPPRAPSTSPGARTAPGSIPARSGSTSPGAVPSPMRPPSVRPPSVRPPSVRPPTPGRSPTVHGVPAPAPDLREQETRGRTPRPQPQPHPPVKAPPPSIDEDDEASAAMTQALRRPLEALAPLAPAPTMITSQEAAVPGTAGALLPPSSVDNVDVTLQRGAQPAPSKSAQSKPPPSVHGWSPAIPAAAPPPKLGSMGTDGAPRAVPPPSVSPQILAQTAQPGAPQPVTAQPQMAQALAPRLGRSERPGAPEPPTKPSMRLPAVGRGEVTQRVRVTQFTLALGLGALVAGALLFGVTRWLSAREREDALARASDDGATVDLVHALEVTESTPATRARLFATVTAELGEDRAAAAELLLEEEPGHVEARIARSLLARARGQVDQALTLLEGLEASGVTLAEAFRARALALDSVGRHAEAQAAALQEWTLRPTGSRHACLLAREALLAGDDATAQSALQSVGDGDSRPCVRALRALGAWQRNDPAAADTEASVVLGALAERAAPSDLAWAHLLRGQAALARNDVAAARSELRQAAQDSPPSDEVLMLRALDALVRVGDAETARTLAARLTPTAPSPTRRAELLVAIALELRDFAGAEASLRTLPAGPRTELVRGRILESQGNDEQALMHYTTAAGDSALAVEASLRRAQLLSRLGRVGDARQALDVAARGAPGDATIAAALAHVALAQGDTPAARAALEPALRAHGDDPRLRAISAILRAGEGERDAALALAREAAAAAASDPEVQLDLAEVARRAGDPTTEAQACGEALRLDPRRFAATLCVVRAAIDAADFARATQLLEEARQRQAPELELSRARADLAVAQGRGAVGVELVRGFTRTHRNDVPLLSALARLQLQAEESGAADDTARRILSIQPENAEALYVRAYAAYVDGHLSTAADLLDRLGRSPGASASGLRARATALRGMLAYEESRHGNPQALADQALAADPRCSTAHLLRALIASRDRDAQRAALQAATQGTDTPAEAVARLALSLGPTPEGCALARRYVEVAPGGYDRRDVDDVRSDCR